MSVEQRVEKELKYQIHTSEKLDAEFKAAMLRWERWPKFSLYVADQWKVFCQKKLSKGLGIPTDKRFKWFIESSLELYQGGMQAHHRRENESAIAKRQRQEAVDKRSDIDQTLNGNPSGDYEDFLIEEVDRGSQEGSQKRS